jgi:hypothetical protein
MIKVISPTDPCYYGIDITAERVDEIIDRMEAMVRSEYADAPFEITFERTAVIGGSGIEGDDKDAVAEILWFLQENWTKAL